MEGCKCMFWKNNRCEDQEVFVNDIGAIVCRYSFNARKMNREMLLENLLKDVLRKWKYDADQGDGLDDEGWRLFNLAQKAAQNCD